MLDCLIIGGGPAGLTGAIYLARYRRGVRVIDAGKSRAAPIPDSHNYPGFRGIAGPALLTRLREQAERCGARIETGTVTVLARDGDGFAATANGGTMKAHTVLLATGLVDHKPPTAGLQDGIAHGSIRFCPICDGFEATGIHNRLARNMQRLLRGICAVILRARPNIRPAKSALH